jgi:DNA-directed RNA polymerase subunit RPC12/RpoP
MFCSKCGNKIDDNDVFCNQCGERIHLTGEIKEVEPIKVEVVNKSKSSYNKWVRAVSVIWGACLLFGSTSGISYFYESGLLLVIICEFFNIIIGIILLLLGLFPEDVNNKIQIKNRYPAIITGLIITSLFIIGIEPYPIESLWDYTPNF